MINLQNFFGVSPYIFNKKDKRRVLNESLMELTRFHYEHCWQYKKILDGMGFDINNNKEYDELPFLPVRLFKHFDLYSVPRESIIKTMTSSGTSGQTVSKIYLDKYTSINQSKALAKIVSSYIGFKRCPMLIIDSESILKNRESFSARGAGILGFSMFGSSRMFALNDKMEIKYNEIISFLKENEGKTIFVFGFTFMIFLHFIQELKKKNMKFDISNGVLIHGGGWKKLSDQSITSIEFRREVEKVSGIKSVHDYYGMVEQVGSINMECEYGNLHTSIFSNIVIRRPNDFTIADVGEKGIVQTLSVLPASYPGHSLLTEDEGILLGEDDCKCGSLGKYFKIIGRIENAEIRGCSDTYTNEFK